MASLAQPAAVPLEFLTWVAWFILFRLLQRRLCRQHPGLRTVCRMIFLWTLVIAVVPGAWTLVFATVHGPRLLAAINHAFGLGVLAQTSLRSLLLRQWLGWPGVRCVTPERFAVASLLAMTEVLRPQAIARLKSRG